MNLSSAQRATLKTAVEAEPTLIAARAAFDDVAVAAWLNAASAIVVWRSSLTASEIKASTVWTELIGRSQGERDVYRVLLDGGSVNPSDINIRQAFADIFSGATGAGSRTNLAGASKRTATRAESLLASGGAGTSLSPHTMGAEGAVTVSDVALILRG